MTQILRRFSTPASPGALIQSIHPDLGVGLPGARLTGVVLRVDSAADGVEVEISTPVEWSEPRMTVGLDIDGVRHRGTYECIGTGECARAGRNQGPSERSVDGTARPGRLRPRSSRTVRILVDGDDQRPVSLALGGGAATGERVHLRAGSGTPEPSVRKSTGSAGFTGTDTRASDTEILDIQAPEIQTPETRGCSISFARSQVSIIDTGTGPLLEVAESAGLTPKFGCRRGVCHRCTTELLAGTTVNTRDGTVSEPGDAVRICVSTPVTDVELNL